MENDKIELFSATWCGHCQRFKPEWDKLTKEMSSIETINYDSVIHKDIIEKKKDIGLMSMKTDG